MWFSFTRSPSRSPLEPVQTQSLESTMTTVRAPARVLVTGASGFLAAGIVQVLVQRGYTAVGTVRSASKGEWFKKTYGDKFEYVVVEDMEKVTDHILAFPIGLRY